MIPYALAVVGWFLFLAAAWRISRLDREVNVWFARYLRVVLARRKENR